jgi:hypothetical protein
LPIKAFLRKYYKKDINNENDALLFLQNARLLGNDYAEIFTNHITKVEIL